jgi:hypothetical protein
MQEVDISQCSTPLPAPALSAVVRLSSGFAAAGKAKGPRTIPEPPAAQAG